MDHAATHPLAARRSGPLKGRLRVPGDKSISLRSLIFGALAVGETRITGLLEGEDALDTAKAVQALGASVEHTGKGAWRIRGVGVGGLAEPSGAARFRQFRHRLQADDGGSRWVSDYRDPRR